MEKQEQGPVTNNDSVSVLPVEAMRKLLPSIITRYVIGARVIDPFEGRKDAVAIEDSIGKVKLSLQDYSTVTGIGNQILSEFGITRVVPAHQIIQIYDRAREIIESMIDKRSGMNGVVMIKDQGGCGYWRMVLPSRYMDRTGIYIDVTGAPVEYNHLLEYQTVVVQRLHDWESVDILGRLKNAGKRIIYDIDDDLFSIPEENPASKAIGRSEQMAALECMKLADVVTVSTSVLQAKLTSMLGKAPVILRNAIDPDDGWQATPFTGSPDGWKRIFWQGSNTHDEDWDECFEAVDHIMMARDDVRVVILGFLPSRIQESMNQAHWKGRIEFMGSLDPEAYFKLIKHVRAEVGLAPLRGTVFNSSKSNIKWMENSMIGMPTVASDIEGYSDCIDHGETGFLCSTPEEWFEAIEKCLDSEVLRKGMVEKARQVIRSEFNIKTVAGTWKDIIEGT